MSTMPTSIHDSHDAYVAEARDDIEYLATSQDLINLFESGDIHEAADEWARGHNHHHYRYLHREFFAKVGEWQQMTEAYERACGKMNLTTRFRMLTEEVIERTLALMVVEYLTDVYTDAVWSILIARDIAGDAVATKYLADTRNEIMAG